MLGSILDWRLGSGLLHVPSPTAIQGVSFSWQRSQAQGRQAETHDAFVFDSERVCCFYPHSTGHSKSPGWDQWCGGGMLRPQNQSKDRERSGYVLGLFGGLNKWIYVKGWGQGLAHSRCHVLINQKDGLWEKGRSNSVEFPFFFFVFLF